MAVAVVNEIRCTAKHAARADVAVFTPLQLLQVSGREHVKALDAKLTYSKPSQGLRDGCSAPVNLLSARFKTCKCAASHLVLMHDSQSNKQQRMVEMSEESDAKTT